MPVRPLGDGPPVVELGLRPTAVRELHAVATTVPVDFDDQPGRQRVDHRHTDAVQAAGHLVTASPELAAAVQLGEGDSTPLNFCWGLMSVGMPRPSSTTWHPPSSRRVTSIRVQSPAMASSTELSTTSHTRWWRPFGPRRSDVHAGSLADRLEALQDGHVSGAIAGGTARPLAVLEPHLHRH